jgi:hypothetical protein
MDPRCADLADGTRRPDGNRRGCGLFLRDAGIQRRSRSVTLPQLKCRKHTLKRLRDTSMGTIRGGCWFYEAFEGVARAMEGVLSVDVQTEG